MRKVRRHGNTNAYPFLMHSWTLDLWYIFAICRWYVKEIFGKVTGALVGRVQGMGIFASIFWYGHPGCQFLLIPLSGTVTIIFRQVICYLLYFTCPSFQDGHHTHTINFTQLYPHCKPLRMAITHRPTLAVLVGCIHPSLVPPPQNTQPKFLFLQIKTCFQTMALWHKSQIPHKYHAIISNMFLWSTYNIKLLFFIFKGNVIFSIKALRPLPLP